ncbi:hypothetical protein BD626DRAFT_426354 [Schizophyllum amplum]|uniref:DUF6589 domain-containing protein n=1 Tax=Schizophyllum amplum TaxID=97359 RepID=A0A550CPP9_9AGAR|nr:hypothetical protein BD626DRAFT_426354 [Auriculariopsis ampla]
MRQESISIPEFMSHVLTSPSPLCHAHQVAFYKTSNCAVPTVLDAMYAHKTGRSQLELWVCEKNLHATLTCEALATEVARARELLQMSSREVSLEYLEGWDLHAIMQPVLEETPVLEMVLDAVLEKKYNSDHLLRMRKANDLPVQFKDLTVSALLHAQTCFASKIQHALGLFAWSTGASRHLIEVQARAHLTPSFTTIQNTLHELAEDAVQRAVHAVDTLPHAFAYDNINLSHSLFIEQRLDSPAKVQSGSFCVIYELYGAHFEHMKIEPMQRRLQNSTDLVLDDIIPSRESVSALTQQFIVRILSTLATYSEDFNYLTKCPELQYTQRRPLPTSHRTKFHPLRATTIEEASVDVNIRLQEDAYLLRANDVSAWNRRDVIQLAMGLFHVTMNLIWAILHIHYGASNQQLGGLNYFFVVMEKARLGNDKPDYHSLLAALTQIFDGLVLNAWRQECGFETLKKFAASKPTSDDLHKAALRVLRKYMSAPGSTGKEPAGDTVFENTCLLLRDLRYAMELVQAIQDGDFGRVEDMYPDLARIFRGAGCNNYASEIVHWIHNVKKVWTPEFANIMRDNSLVNIDGKFMAIDLNIEHLIGVLKVCPTT